MSPVTHEQLRIELVLQCPYLAGKRGLGDVEPLGSPAEVELFGDGDEVPDFAKVKIHPTPSLPASCPKGITEDEIGLGHGRKAGAS